MQPNALPTDTIQRDAPATSGPAAATRKLPRGPRTLVAGSLAAAVAGTLLGVYGLGFARGTATPDAALQLPAVLHATATHGGQDMAVATGQITDDTEGLFTLDFKTGDLKCFVFYPRVGAIGGIYYTNVTEALSATKNAEYLMVTGRTLPQSSTSNDRPAQSLVYVVDTKSGQFAAYALAYNQTMESAGQQQQGPLVLVARGEARPPSAGGVRRPLPAGPGLPGAAAVDPNAPADPRAVNPNAPQNPNVPNRNRRR